MKSDVAGSAAAAFQGHRGSCCAALRPRAWWLHTTTGATARDAIAPLVFIHRKPSANRFSRTRYGMVASCRLRACGGCGSASGTEARGDRKARGRVWRSRALRVGAGHAQLAPAVSGQRHVDLSGVAQRGARVSASERFTWGSGRDAHCLSAATARTHPQLRAARPADDGDARDHPGDEHCNARSAQGIAHACQTVVRSRVAHTRSTCHATARKSALRPHAPVRMASSSRGRKSVIPTTSHLAFSYPLAFGVWLM